MSDDMVPLPLDDVAALAEEVATEGWVPRDDAAVERALRLLDRLAARAERVRVQAAAWRAEIDGWEQAEVRRLTGPANAAVVGLEGFALAQRRVTGVKSFAYPSGTIETRAGRDKVVVTDEAALLAWCRSNAPDAIKSTEAVLVSKLPTHQVRDGRMIVDGEIVPGVTVQEGANYTTASVKLTSSRELPRGRS